MTGVQIEKYLENFFKRFIPGILGIDIHIRTEFTFDCIKEKFLSGNDLDEKTIISKI